METNGDCEGARRGVYSSQEQVDSCSAQGRLGMGEIEVIKSAGKDASRSET